ncbi:MAG: metal-dependent hydrolase [Chloroflexi bacterium GWB2_49_20]|nr:MAG: metal-dependent hydrolase [Chloroflexi bacterium GWB2_49_20]OGN77072.1 MAG: metal-dependent hydrolase [Chloroflexi bacterium GWC2_49_37]OGN83798.1 MAG: metal-dependent hydrolase [Chloroflexi bacterium GWD2_49_16]HCM96876.1 metal-dependent hydrolase [Anaerolineae bacterium]
MLPTQNFELDRFATSAGSLEITFIGHGSLILAINGLIIHVDPYSKQANYALLPKADIILVTHEHSDHMDLTALNQVLKTSTQIIYTKACERQLKGGLVMKNGDKQTVKGIPLEAVPAYNQINTRGNGDPFHPKGEGNGYVLTFGDQRVYIAGDTENLPEMGKLKGIDIAFLPMNLPYTMTPEMVAQAAFSFKPRILYPYHYGQTDTSKLENLLQTEKQIEVRIRKMA